MYNTVVNPETGRRVSIHGRKGQEVLRNYYDQAGGKPSWKGFKKDVTDWGTRKATAMKNVGKQVMKAKFMDQGTDFTNLRQAKFDRGVGATVLGKVGTFGTTVTEGLVKAVAAPVAMTGTALGVGAVGPAMMKGAREGLKGAHYVAKEAGESMGKLGKMSPCHNCDIEERPGVPLVGYDLEQIKRHYRCTGNPFTSTTEGKKQDLIQKWRSKRDSIYNKLINDLLKIITDGPPVSGFKSRDLKNGIGKNWWMDTGNVDVQRDETYYITQNKVRNIAISILRRLDKCVQDCSTTKSKPVFLSNGSLGNVTDCKKDITSWILNKSGPRTPTEAGNITKLNRGTNIIYKILTVPPSNVTNEQRSALTEFEDTNSTTVIDGVPNFPINIYESEKSDSNLLSALRSEFNRIFFGAASIFKFKIPSLSLPQQKIVNQVNELHLDDRSRAMAPAAPAAPNAMGGEHHPEQQAVQQQQQAVQQQAVQQQAVQQQQQVAERAWVGGSKIRRKKSRNNRKRSAKKQRGGRRLSARNAKSQPRKRSMKRNVRNNSRNRRNSRNRHN